MTIKSVFGVALAVFLACSLSQAEDAKVLPKHPGDIIKYEVKFDGPNADKIKTVGAGLHMRGPISKDQSGFIGSFGTGHQVLPSPSKTFILEMTVPNDSATGDYFLNVGASSDEGSASYEDGQEFTIPPVHIENPKTFTPPRITVKPLS